MSDIFKQALQRQDVHAEQRKLQQDKFDSRLKKYEGDVQQLERKLSQKNKEFNKLHDNVNNLEVKIDHSCV